MVEVINSHSQFKELINSGDIVVVDFWATWCGPCKAISPEFERLSKSGDFPTIKFYKVDVDEQPDISAEVGIRAMPTFKVFRNGAEVDNLVGADKTKLLTLLQQANVQ